MSLSASLRTRLFLLIPVVVLLPYGLTAQSVTGGVTGRVTDAAGAPLDGAEVTLSGSGVQGRRGVVTDDRGSFRFQDVPVGTVSVLIRRIGYRSFVFTGVVVALGRTASLPVAVLAVSPLPLEPVRVEVDALLVDARSTGLGGTFDARDLAQLPGGREYASLIELLPQANTSYLGDAVNVGGSTGLANAYHVEGVNVTDPYRGRAGMTLPRNFVRAIELKAGGYEAEFGGALGGIVNVVTHSGGNDLRVAGFGSFTGDALAAKAQAVPGVQERSSASDFDAGISVSGPLARDRLWFFSAYNPRRTRADVLLPGFDVQEARLTRHAFATKLDWRAGERLDLALSVVGDPTTERRVRLTSGSAELLNPDPILTSHRDGGVASTLRGTFALSDGVRFEAFVSRYDGREDIHGATELGRNEPTFIDRRDLPKIRLSGGNQSDQGIRSARTAVRFAGAVTRGRHTAKAGFEVQEARLGVLIRENPGQVTQLEDALFQASYFNQDFTVRNRVSSLFAQDSWAVTSRLRLNVGLRWDGEALIDQNGAVGQRLSDQFQPRLGLVYQPGAQGKHKIFAHVGRFYQQLALHWATLTLAGFDQRQVFSSVDPRQAPDAADSTRVFSDPATIRGGVEGLKGQYHDEIVLGYERRAGAGTTVGLQATRREIGSTVTMAFQPEGELVGGNPGRGALSHLPRSQRTYSALGLTVEHRSEDLRVFASYLLSRNEGNYAGLYAADAGGLRGGSFGPNNDMLTYFPAQTVNNTGLLPNDRPHVLKLAGALDVRPGLSVGTTFTAASGTPLSEFGNVPSGFNTPLFLIPRGSAGRGPAVWDLSFRVSFDTELGGLPGRIVADLLHVGNPQSVVRIDQRRFNGARGSPYASYEQIVGNQRGERSSFGDPVGFQEPFALRIGVELGAWR